MQNMMLGCYEHKSLCLEQLDRYSRDDVAFAFSKAHSQSIFADTHSPDGDFITILQEDTLLTTFKLDDRFTVSVLL